MTRAQKIIAILDRMDYHNQTPQRLAEAIVEIVGDETEAGDGTWQELIELATRARARAHHHFLNTKTHDLFIECAERLEAVAPTTTKRETQ